MNIKLLAAYSRCATFEISSQTCYFAPQPFTVMLNGTAAGEFTQNVFTLYNLLPATQYTLHTQGAELCFTTRAESCCIRAQAAGAVPDGITDCTAALQQAIDTCTPGGTVLVESGVYLTYPLFLKTGVTLYLQKGAVLRGGTVREKYPVLPGMVQNEDFTEETNFGTWEGNPLDCFASLITAMRQDNVAVLGEGTLDGNAQNGDWWQDAKRRRLAWRPRTVFANGCRGVDIVGVTILNSPSWTLHPYYCDNVTILNIQIRNPDDSPNTDGIDPESCDNVLVAGALVSVGDDCIAIKSGKMYMAMQHHKPTRRCTVRNCLLERGHGAVVIGSEVAGGVDGVSVSQCAMRNTDRGLRIKTRRGRGERCVLTNIEFTNIEMERVLTPFVINMFYCCDPDGRSDYVAGKKPLPVDKNTPRVGTLTCRHIRALDCSVAGAFLYGLPEQPVENVLFDDVEITFKPDAEEDVPAMMVGITPMKKMGLFAENVHMLTLKNVRIAGNEGSAMRLHHVEKLVEE